MVIKIIVIKIITTAATVGRPAAVRTSGADLKRAYPLSRAADPYDDGRTQRPGRTVPG